MKGRRQTKPLGEYVSKIDILPPVTIKNDNNKTTMRKKNPNLKVFTNTWPPKSKENKTETEEGRPLTATLDKPQILDIRFIRKIDMSLIRKEFLCITNLCATPLALLKLPRKSEISSRPLSLPSCSTMLSDEKPSERSKTSQDINKKISVAPSAKNLKKLVLPIKNLTRVQMSKGVIKKAVNDSNNNQKLLKLIPPNATPNKIPSCDKNRLLIKLPEPCTTCGRPDQPERFHSHPITPLKPLRKMSDAGKVQIKSTVQKPVAMKYKSKHTGHKPEIAQSEGGVMKGEETKRAGANRIQTGKGPKAVMCYLCGRDFGTASLPFHEPRCLEKWNRENDSLPPNQRRKPPQKPTIPMTAENWNQHAWESCQASLVPCGNCGRTFLPDRLTVHQRSCKNANKVTDKTPCQYVTRSPVSSAPPRSVSCSICGRLFGKMSIKIHEPQCLKKWKIQNELLPPHEKQPLSIVKSECTVSIGQDSHVSEKKHTTRTNSSEKPALIPCYLCGKLFSVAFINIHEPQCLKKWQSENEKLPPSKRRSEPMKSDIKFTPSGAVDFVGTFKRIWSNHMNKLIPCTKCKRTFFPERITKHEEVCIGKTIKSNKKSVVHCK